MVFGAGAIGGVLGARLHQAGDDVALIARGAHHDAIARQGLSLETPNERTVLKIPVVDGPAGVDWGEDDVVLLTTKTQDSQPALAALHDAAGSSVPVACLQNGVENERLALRLFERVYAGVVMAPTAHLEPGVVQAYGTTMTGVVDLGSYPSGVDERCRAIAAALRAARFSSGARPDIMRFKYAKLIANLANVVEVICGPHADAEELVLRARGEGREVLQAAGVEFVAEEVDDIRSRWQRLGVREIDGRQRAGSSTWQSIIRGTGTVETDYLNGEIVLLARLNRVEAPINELLQELARDMVRDGRAPGWLSAEQVLGRLASGSAA